MNTVAVEGTPEIWDAVRESSEPVPLQIEGFTGEDMALLSVAAGSTALVLLVGGAIVGTATILATVTVGSAAIMWIKIPERIEQLSMLRAIIKKTPDRVLSPARKQAMLDWNWKTWADRNEIAIDLGFSVVVTAMFGFSVTGLVAGGLAGLGVSVLLRFRRLVRHFSSTVLRPAHVST